MATLVYPQLVRSAGGIVDFNLTSYLASGGQLGVVSRSRLSHRSGSRVAADRRVGHLQGREALRFPLWNLCLKPKNYAHARAARLPIMASSVRPLSMEQELKQFAVMFFNDVGHVLKRTAALFETCSPVVAEVVPAVGLIAYSIWGLGPMTRTLRKLAFKRNDKKWEESRTYNIMASYMRPISLWIGVILICRAFDPVMLSTEASQAIKQRFVNFVRSLSTVLAFAFCTASLTQQVQKFMMENQDAEESRNVGVQFIGNTVYTSVWIAAVCLFMELLGFSTQKWITAGGFGTVLITLAGREILGFTIGPSSLGTVVHACQIDGTAFKEIINEYVVIFTNFLSSIMIHATRPFVDNEWIQTKIEGQEVSGTVEHVGWWSPTVIRGDDREAVHIPNHKFSVSVVRNLSQKTHWRIKTHLGISHLDVSKMKPIVADMRKVLAKHPQVEQQRLHRRVFFDQIDPENQALMILISCFVKTSHFEEYLRVKEIILLDLLKVIGHHGARLATPIRSVQRVLDESESRTSPFRDIRNANQNLRRPLLLSDSDVAASDDEEEADKDDIQDTITRLVEQLAKVEGAVPAPTENVGSVGDLKSPIMKSNEVVDDGSLQTLEDSTSSDDDSVVLETSANSKYLMGRIYAGSAETLVKFHLLDTGSSLQNLVNQRGKAATTPEECFVKMPEETVPQLFSNNVGLDESPSPEGEIRALSVKVDVNVHTDQILKTSEEHRSHVDKQVGVQVTVGSTPYRSLEPPSTAERDKVALEDSQCDDVMIDDERHVCAQEKVNDRNVEVRFATEDASMDDPWKQAPNEALGSSSDSWRESSALPADSSCEDPWSQPSVQKAATSRPSVDPKHTFPLDEDTDSLTLVALVNPKENAAGLKKEGISSDTEGN